MTERKTETIRRQDMTPRERFAENLIRARRAANVTQEQLADRCHLHRTEVSLLERGGREPRLSTLIKLAGALGVTLESLCAGMGWNEARRRFEYGDGRGKR